MEMALNITQSNLCIKLIIIVLLSFCRYGTPHTKIKGQSKFSSMMPDSLDALGIDDNDVVNNKENSYSERYSAFASIHSAWKLFPWWTNPEPLHVLCGDNNRAFFGSCLASTAKRLEIQLNSTEQINPGLFFQLSVWKVDFYNQTVSSDSSTFLKIQTMRLLYSDIYSTNPLQTAIVSGEAVFQLVHGRATVSVGVEPYITKIEADSGLIHLAGEAVIFAAGLDAESSITLRCVILNLS
jgi:hypothetical protein